MRLAGPVALAVLAACEAPRHECDETRLEFEAASGVWATPALGPFGRILHGAAGEFQTTRGAFVASAGGVNLSSAVTADMEENRSPYGLTAWRGSSIFKRMTTGDAPVHCVDLAYEVLTAVLGPGDTILATSYEPTSGGRLWLSRSCGAPSLLAQSPVQLTVRGLTADTWVVAEYSVSAVLKLEVYGVDGVRTGVSWEKQPARIIRTPKFGPWVAVVDGGEVLFLSADSLQLMTKLTLPPSGDGATGTSVPVSASCDEQGACRAIVFDSRGTRLVEETAVSEFSPIPVGDCLHVGSDVLACDLGVWRVSSRGWQLDTGFMDERSLRVTGLSVAQEGPTLALLYPDSMPLLARRSSDGWKVEALAGVAPDGLLASQSGFFAWVLVAPDSTVESGAVVALQTRRGSSTREVWRRERTADERVRAPVVTLADSSWNAHGPEIVVVEGSAGCSVYFGQDRVACPGGNAEWLSAHPTLPSVWMVGDGSGTQVMCRSEVSSISMATEQFNSLEHASRIPAIDCTRSGTILAQGTELSALCLDGLVSEGVLLGKKWSVRNSQVTLE